MVQVSLADVATYFDDEGNPIDEVLGFPNSSGWKIVFNKFDQLWEVKAKNGVKLPGKFTNRVFALTELKRYLGKMQEQRESKENRGNTKRVVAPENEHLKIKKGPVKQDVNT